MRTLGVLGLIGVLCGLLAGCRSEKPPEAAPPAPRSREDAGTAVSEPAVEDGSKTFFVVKRTPISLRPDPEAGTIGKPLPVLSEIRLRVPDDGGWAELPDGGGFVERSAISETRPSGERAEELAIDALSRGALSEARAFAALSDAGSLNAALAVGQPPPEPVVVAPMEDGGTDGGTFEAGQVRYVAAVGSGLRAKPETNAELSIPLAVNDAVRVLELSDGWARAAVGATPAAPTQDTDGGTRTKEGSGWIPRAHLSEAKLTPEPLLALASEDPSAYAALRVAEALTGDSQLWPKLVTSAMKTGQPTEAMRWAYELAADESVRDMVFNYVYGCRGNHLTATFVDEKRAETGDLPKDACVYDLSAPPCPSCRGQQGGNMYDLEVNRTREKERRARIRKRFPRGPAVEARIPGGLVTSRRLFLYAVPITFQYLRCEQYETEVRVQRMVFSKPIALMPTPHTEWLFSTAPEQFHGNHVLFGALLARDEEDVRKRVATWPYDMPRDPGQLVPAPNAYVNMDLCSECISCD